MEKLFSGLLAVGIGLGSLTVLPMAQTTWAQTQNSQTEELLQLNNASNTTDATSATPRGDRYMTTSSATGTKTQKPGS